MLVRKPNVREGAGNTLKLCACQAEERVKIATVREIMGTTSTGSCCPSCRTRRSCHCRSARRRRELEDSKQKRLSHQIYLATGHLGRVSASCRLPPQKFAGGSVEFASPLEECQVPGGYFPIGGSWNAVCQFTRLRDDLIMCAGNEERGAADQLGLIAHIDQQIELLLAGNPLPIGKGHIAIDHFVDRGIAHAGYERPRQSRKHQ